MTILRPVTQLLPQSTSSSEESNLPFSFVLTPYGKISYENESNGNKSEQKDVDSEDQALLPADSVPKCGSCGAPINPCSPVYSYPTKPLCAVHSEENGEEYKGAQYVGRQEIPRNKEGQV